MKKFTKLCLIVSLACVCIAAICLGAGVAMGSGIKEVRTMADAGAFNVGALHIGSDGFYFGSEEVSSEDMEIQEGTVNDSFAASEVDSLDIDIKYGEVYFIDSDSDQIQISIDAPKRNVYKCKNENGTLTLKDKTSSYKWNTGMMNKHDVTVTIAIPKGKEFDEVTLITNAGSMEITHQFLARELDLEVDAGELIGEQLEAKNDFSIDVGAGNLEIQNLQAKNLEVDCGVGEVNIGGKVSKKVDADCGVGQITMALIGNENDYDYEINCGIGSVSINGTTYSSLATEQKIDNNAGNKINLDCGVGEIDVTVKED